MRSRAGFTLIEAAVVMAVISILAAITIGASRAAKRNAGVASNTYDIATRLQGERFRALETQSDRVVVFVDAPSASTCGMFNDAACGHMYIISPQPSWTIADFNSSPTQNATLIDTYSYAMGVRLSSTTQVAGPAPFNGVTTFDSQLLTTCGGLACIAVRFSASGEVSAVPPGNAGTKGGVGLVLATDLEGVTAAARRYSLIVGIPTGVVKYTAF